MFEGADEINAEVQSIIRSKVLSVWRGGKMEPVEEIRALNVTKEGRVDKRSTRVGRLLYHRGGGLNGKDYRREL